MPRLQKMNEAGLLFLRKLYENNPEMPFAQMLPIYNNEAAKRGWASLRSSGTIGYHLTTMGLYKTGSRIAPVDVESLYRRKIRQRIEMDAKGKAKLAKTFGVTVQNVSQALLFKRNSVQAGKIREAAMKNGASLVQIIDVTDTLKRLLDSKGNVKAVIANDTITL